MQFEQYLEIVTKDLHEFVIKKAYQLKGLNVEQEISLLLVALATVVHGLIISAMTNTDSTFEEKALYFTEILLNIHEEYMKPRLN